jgi:hypothetical protein
MSFILTYNSLKEKISSYLERNDETVINDFDAWVKFAHERIGRDSNTQLFEVYISGNFTAGISVMPKPARWQNTITFNYGSGANNVTLGNNPLSTGAFSPIVTVTIPSTTNLVNGQNVIISGAEDTGGIPSFNLNITTPITIIDGTHFTFIANSVSTSVVAAGGGASVIASFPSNNNYTPVLLRSFEYARSFWPDQSMTSPPKFYADYGYYNWLISPTPDHAYPFVLGYLETPQVIDINYQSNYLTEFMPEVLLKAVLLEAMLTLKNDERIPVIESEYVKVLSSWNAKNELRKVDRYTTRKAD